MLRSQLGDDTVTLAIQRNGAAGHDQDAIKARGGVVTREAGPMKHGTTVIAFVQDPDGYKIELIQKGTL